MINKTWPLDEEDSESFEGMSDRGNPIYGYGIPTQGEYNATEKEWKTYGSVGQGDILKGIKRPNSIDCEPRHVLLTIYAKEDWNENDQLILDAGAWQFD